MSAAESKRPEKDRGRLGLHRDILPARLVLDTHPPVVEDAGLFLYRSKECLCVTRCTTLCSWQRLPRRRCPSTLSPLGRNLEGKPRPRRDLEFHVRHYKLARGGSGSA